MTEEKKPIRQIVLDTETTGLEPQDGHRIIEIGALELIERRPTGKHFHRYLNPEREVEEGALQVHGLSNEFLQDKQRFGEVAHELLDFIEGAELIIHNAPFDVGFIDHELNLFNDEIGKVQDYATILDTLILARELHPGQRNSLDALCRRYEVDNSNRQLHGALLDAELLLDVYLAMTGGQSALDLNLKRTVLSDADHADLPPVVVAAVKVSDDELALHAERITAIDKASESGVVWKT